jgi:hypothetical protein
MAGRMSEKTEDADEGVALALEQSTLSKRMGVGCLDVRKFEGRRVLASSHGDGPHMLQLSRFQVMFFVTCLALLSF